MHDSCIITPPYHFSFTNHHHLHLPHVHKVGQKLGVELVTLQKLSTHLLSFLTQMVTSEESKGVRQVGHGPSCRVWGASTPTRCLGRAMSHLDTFQVSENEVVSWENRIKVKRSKAVYPAKFRYCRSGCASEIWLSEKKCFDHQPFTTSNPPLSRVHNPPSMTRNTLILSPISRGLGITHTIQTSESPYMHTHARFKNQIARLNTRNV